MKKLEAVVERAVRRALAVAKETPDSPAATSKDRTRTQVSSADADTEKPTNEHDPVGEVERFPLRASHLEALKAAVSQLGAAHVAAAVGTTPVHVAYYVLEHAPPREPNVPSVTDRQRIIAWLLRSGAVKPAPGEDFFAPDGSEGKKAVRAWRRHFGPDAGAARER